MEQKTIITKDVANKRLRVTREFNASPEKVWKAWTDSDVLDKWWAPKPWKAETKTMDFRVGGIWLYSMASPEGELHWSRVDFTAITPGKSFVTTCKFSDEQGESLPDAPAMHWHNKFTAAGTGTRVEVELTFDDEAGMQKMMAMGFEGGFTMGLNNLEELLAREA